MLIRTQIFTLSGACEIKNKAEESHSFLIANHYKTILLKTVEDSNNFHIICLRGAKSLEKRVQYSVK